MSVLLSSILQKMINNIASCLFCFVLCKIFEIAQGEFLVRRTGADGRFCAFESARNLMQSGVNQGEGVEALGFSRGRRPYNQG
jgi:hypothetical protein